MSRQNEADRKDRNTGRRRANEVEGTYDHRRQMNVREDDGDSRDWCPQEWGFQADI